MSVASPCSPITVARRSVVASAGDQSTASLTSPPSLTHSASTPDGTRSWSMPGATFTSERWVRRSSTHGHGGVHPSTSNTRPRPPRRAGSAKATSKAAAPIVVASPTCTAPARPSASRLARAIATRTGSRSTPPTTSPARAKARRSPPMPQPRSMTLPPGIAAATRAARWSATRARVDCSSASGVKNIRCAASPNFATAFARSCACVVAAAAFSASGSRRRTTAATRTGSPACSAQARVASTSRRAPSAVRSQSSVSTCMSSSCQRRHRLALDRAEC